jgi:hypothetical protein
MPPLRSWNWVKLVSAVNRARSSFAAVHGVDAPPAAPPESGQEADWLQQLQHEAADWVNRLKDMGAKDIQRARELAKEVKDVLDGAKEAAKKYAPGLVPSWDNLWNAIKVFFGANWVEWVVIALGLYAGYKLFFEPKRA